MEPAREPYLYLSLINSLSFDLFLNAWAAVLRLFPFPLTLAEWKLE